jgi:hypothetical protein
MNPDVLDAFALAVIAAGGPPVGCGWPAGSLGPCNSFALGDMLITT